MQHWADVTGQVRDARGTAHPYGVALLNDSKYGCDILGGEIRLSVLRSTIFGSARPAAVNPKAGYPYQDQGWQECRWALVPHAGPWQAAGVVQAAHGFNTPLPFVREYVHPGTLPPQHSFLSVSPADTLVVTAFKQAEDGDGVVLRLYEPHGRPASATVTAAGATFPVQASPNQIKSYRITAPGAVKAVNFLEE